MLDFTHLIKQNRTVPSLLAFAKCFLDKAFVDYTAPKAFAPTNTRAAAAALILLEYENHSVVEVEFIGHLAEKYALPNITYLAFMQKQDSLHVSFESLELQETLTAMCTRFKNVHVMLKMKGFQRRCLITSSGAGYFTFKPLGNWK